MLRPRIILVIVVAAVAFFSAGAYAYWYFLIRGPFAGETLHDFGEVELYDETAELAYTFHLTNRLAHPLTINAVRPECGCVTVGDLHKTIQPGEAFDLPVKFVAKGGPRTVPIYVIFGDDSEQTLRVRAVGKPQPRLWMAVPATVLADDGTAPVEFIAFTYESYDQPPTATITASSAAIAGEFVSWTMKYRPKDIFLAPTIWEGHARARVNAGAALPADAALKLTIPHARPLEVAIKPVGSTLPSSVAPPFVPPTLEEREPTTRPGAERLQGGG